MNIRAANIIAKPQVAPRRRSFARVIGTALKIILLLLTAGGVTNGYIYLNQQSLNIDRSIRKVKRDLHNTNREISHLRIRREELSAWPHISSQIARYGLNLRHPEPGQVRTLALLHNDAPSSRPLVGMRDNR